MATIDAQLSGMRDALEADGYELRMDGLEAGRLRLSIVATDGACEECLVPKAIMIQMIQQALNAESGVAEIDVRYPTE